ncbi:MAG TPA: hypothetical protein VNA44_06185 [Burkholderiaceae bacterium]|nr:hypothetical protein [Burkholderiaceae bacterium]
MSASSPPMGLVLRELAPLAAVVAVLLGVLLVVFAGAQDDAQHRKHPSVDHLIVDTQLGRLRERKPFDLALLGDSSCLMGIVASLLRDELKIEAENYCTIGYIGPAGYAAMIHEMATDQPRPPWIILAIHPIQFVRDASWESWVAYVARSNEQNNRVPLTIQNALAFAREYLDRTVVYAPMPGSFALYYGGTGTVETELRTSRGSMLDPGYGLRAGSAQLLEAQTSPPGFGAISNITPNEAFMDALIVLASRMRIAHARVLLLVTPVPAGVLGAREYAELNTVRGNIAQTLGLSPVDILDMPLQMPAAYFSSQTHLNRWGRVRYTEHLAKALQARIDNGAPQIEAADREEPPSANRRRR